MKNKAVRAPLSAAQIIIIGFFIIILIGAGLLMLPVSTVSGTSAPPETAFFTAVSATCITGLVIEDTVLYWSSFGQAIILLMIQIGGIGFMSMAILLSFVIRRKISPRERSIMAQSLGLSRTGGTIRLVKRILIGTFLFEGCGAVILSTQFIPLFGWSGGIWRSIFHAVSAFCNAGFDLMGDYSSAYSNLAAFNGNPVVLLTLMLLIICGGIGFLVWDDLVDFVRHKNRISVYTRFVLLATAILLVFGTLLVYLFEMGNPETLGKLPVGQRFLAAAFHSVSTRTAGFSSIDNALFTDSTKMISVIFMLIGGAAGSTAGGLKVGTVGLILYTVFYAASGRSEIILFKRKISQETILRAVSIVGIGLILTFLSAFSIALSDNIPFLSALYETASAIATVGLSLSLTPSLSLFAHCVLMLLMFFGKVGFLTVTFSILLRSSARKKCIAYPETNILIG